MSERCHLFIIGNLALYIPPGGCDILFAVQIDGERILNFKEVTSKGILWGSILMAAAACLTDPDLLFSFFK